jgi:uncharacterized protein (TIGR03437 family)
MIFQCFRSRLRPSALSLFLAGSSVVLAQQYTITTLAGGAPPSTPAQAVSVSIGQPQRPGVDAAGNLYFSSSSNCVFKMDVNGVLTLIAGSSRPGYSGDGGPAVNAQLSKPQGVALDAAGDIFISDSLNNVVREVTPDGIISSVVGTAAPGYTGDGGQAQNAQLDRPGGIAFDKSGNLYIADSGNNVVREVLPDGTISTFAGINEAGYAGDAGLANAANLTNPEDVAIDSNGNVFIADTGNAVIREVTNGNISTFAGTGAVGHTGDGGKAYLATLDEPQGVAVDSSGNLYISEFGDNQIRKVTNDVITTIAGTSVFGFGGDGGAATKAELANPWGIAVDSGGNAYVADLWNYRIRKISSSGTMSTVAGNGLFSYSGDGASAAKSELDGPQGVAMDAAGNVYIADTQNNVVRRIASNGVITTFVGTGVAGSNGDGGQAAAAQLDKPQSVAVDATGNVYIADTQNSRVRVVTADGSINTFAGTGNGGYSGDGGQAVSAQLNQPYGLTFDASGSLYIADFNNSRVRKVTPDGNIATVAGNGGTFFNGDGGQAASSALNRPQSVAVDSAGDVYIADTQNNRVRMVATNGIITTVAGTGAAGFSGDGGQALKAQLTVPGSVAVDSDGNLYIGDSNARIRKVSADGTIVTIAGGSATGYSGDAGPAVSAQLSGPFGLALDTAGDLYVADSGNNAVRLLRPTGFTASITAVSNSGSNLAGPVAPGEVVAIYGSGLGPAQLTQFQLDSNGLIPTNLAGTRVLFNGTPAPILYAFTSQVAAVVPFGVAVGANAQVVVQYQAQTSAAFSVAVASAAPGLISADGSGQGQAQAANQDGSINSASTAAPVGSVISLFGTGGGQLSPSGIEGSIASAPLPRLLLPVTVTIGGQQATVQSAGAAAGQVEGVMQIDVSIPAGIPPGSAIPVVVQAGGVSSQDGITIAVSAN